MPVYTYRCLKCKREFDVRQGMHDKKLDECPTCCGIVEKLIPKNVGMSCKGEGFYCNDK